MYFRAKASENSESNDAELFDGDKIAVLIVTYIREQLKVIYFKIIVIKL